MGVAVGLKSHCFKFRGVKCFWRRSSGDSRFSESPWVGDTVGGTIGDTVYDR